MAVGRKWNKTRKWKYGVITNSCYLMAVYTADMHTHYTAEGTHTHYKVDDTAAKGRALMD